MDSNEFQGFEKERPKYMTLTARERLSEKNGPHKSIFRVLRNEKHEVRNSTLM